MTDQFDDFDDQNIVAQPKASMAKQGRQPVYQTQMPEQPINKGPIFSGNPLEKYKRSPYIHIKLPSQGYYSNPNDIEFTMSGEIPVLPMTTNDELVLKNPDALMTGYAVEKVLSSCCPGIRNVRKLPSPDVDALLLAIRASTYGENLEMQVTCPKCKEENEFSINLRMLISNITLLEREYPVHLKDMIVYLRPYTFELNVKAAGAAFEETKRIQAIQDQPIDDMEKMKLINISLERINNLSNELNGLSIEKIIVAEGEVTDSSYIIDFLRNTDKKTNEIIDNKLKEINNTGIAKSHPVQCKNEECKHAWSPELEFDPSRFFE